ncbi:uncharacterized protein BX663DRAFT_524786 [Cokeromyces recurvatus]|uniref:uncharacterized protein n=1 Tax=Cokeromyces recurvatus TaxID=90255 RepID=UPI00221E569F|nr:uncharacterized protein BX663DRAFT_524786 [Cokeromyces recurvatus]KAI7898457.1 hypothetical protein BX663DRAFT_524786 [Cokeromyces recurvatus]
MIIKRSRSIFHLKITENTALRVVLYVAKDDIDWYNNNDLHNQVLKTLYPVILDTLLKEQETLKKQYESSQRIIYENGFRILYRFTLRNTHQTLIKTVKHGINYKYMYIYFFFGLIDSILLGKEFHIQ